MNFRRNRASAALAVLLGAGLLLTVDNAPDTPDWAFVSSAHAQPLRKLIARLRGQTLPTGIVKAEGRTEAKQVDVSSKYSGQLAEISVEEGTKVTIGQPIARVSSPEIEAELRGAQADLQTAKDALTQAQSDIASRQAALEFAKSDFERGQELMKSGFITKQIFEERQRNYEAADAAVREMTARKDEAQASIQAAAARVDEVQSKINDLTLVSPRNGQVQYQLKRLGEIVAAGEPIVTVSDLTDIYLVIFLRAADAGRLGLGAEARVVLDAVPDYVIPASVSFVASDSQFTPKTVETEAERTKLMFRVQLRIDPQDLEKYYGRVGPGLKGAGFVQTRPDVKWPAELEVKLPPAPVAPEPKSGLSPAPAPEAPTSTQRPATVAEAPAPPPAAEQPASAPSTITEATSPAPAATAPASTPTAASQEEAAAEPGAQEQEPAEFAPSSFAQLTGAWASSAADCDTLFQRRGKTFAYRQPVDQFAQAAIFDSQRIRLPSSTCQVQSAFKEGGALQLTGECKDSISYTSRIVNIRLRSNTELVYNPFDNPALETTLTKCPL